MRLRKYPLLKCRMCGGKVEAPYFVHHVATHLGQKKEGSQ